MSRIKAFSELQHALAHLWLAVDYAVRDEPKAARYELDSIEGLIFFDDEADRLNYLKENDMAANPCRDRRRKRSKKKARPKPKPR